jgi:hypothetical protein
MVTVSAAYGLQALADARACNRGDAGRSPLTAAALVDLFESGWEPRCHLCRLELDPELALGHGPDGDWFCGDFDGCNERACKRLGVRGERKPGRIGGAKGKRLVEACLRASARYRELAEGGDFDSDPARPPFVPEQEQSHCPSIPLGQLSLDCGEQLALDFDETCP